MNYFKKLFSSKVIIPIGIDCRVAKFLEELGLRNFSLPFDWVVSYSGVAKIIENEFLNYSNEKGINFVHHEFPRDNVKINRRIKRFLNLLKGNQEIIFLRKGHSEHHHDESNFIKDDLDDCLELYDLLKRKYKNLKFKIILFVVCSNCFKPEKKYQSDKVIVYNISEKKYRAELIKKLFHDFENQTGIKKQYGQRFAELNL